MAQLKLVIANKNVSSWSMRPWVLLAEAGIPFDEEFVPFGVPDWIPRVGSPSGRVPMLIDTAVAESKGSGAVLESAIHGLRVWDSLAICEYVAELFPDKQLWPVAGEARAVARSVSSEMHSGFPDMRRECSMNLMLRSDRELSPSAQSDVRRVDALFADCRARFGAGGDLLFGKFSVADAMFAPVAGRVRTYGLKLSAVSQRYVDAVWALQSVRRWEEDARAEVAAGIADRAAHGALFSRGEAERIARRWTDALNANQIDARLSLCAEAVQARGSANAQGRAELRAAWSSSPHASAPHPAGALSLEGFGWDGDANVLTLRLAGARAGDANANRRAEVLAFDSSGLVIAIDSYSA